MNDASPKLLRLSGATVHLERGRVVRDDGEAARLTTRESELLRYLHGHLGEDVSREDLLAEVWGYSDAVVSRAVDNTIRRLRTKIERDAQAPEHLLTVYGVGYRLVLAEVPAEVTAAATRQPTLRLGPVEVALSTGRVSRPDGEARLTATELDALGVLSGARGGVVERARLARRLERMPGRAIDVLVHRLRAKIEVDPSSPTFLRAVRGRGYQLLVDQVPAPRGRVALAVARVAELGRWYRELPEVVDGALERVVVALEGGVEASGGRLLDTPGPTCWAAFADAADAVAWARDQQLALLELDWPEALLAHPSLAPVRDVAGQCLYAGLRVEIVLHWGDAEPSAPRARRYRGPGLAELEQGLERVEAGQILASTAIVAELPAGALADFDVEVCNDPGWASLLPAALRGRQFHNVSEEVPDLGPGGPLIGREAELAEASARLERDGLVVLRGTGGVGKTRLARELVARHEADGAPAALWCSLTGVTADEAVLDAALATAGVPPRASDEDSLRVLRQHLTLREHTLLVLDNADAVPGGAGALVEALAGAARIVVTTRDRVTDEDLAVAPLGVEDAEQLLVERVRRRIPGFAVLPSQRRALRDLVLRLGRLPLALELAAGWVGVLSLGELEERLRRDASLLDHGTGRDSLSEVVAWSWTQLDPWEVRALVTVCAFAGGVFSDVAEEVLDVRDTWPDAPGPLALARRLEERSLLWTEAHPTGARLVPYEAVRHYVAAHRAALAEDRRTAQQRLVAHFVQFGRPHYLEVLSLASLSEVRERLLAELDNLVRVVRIAPRSDDAAALGLLVIKLLLRVGRSIEATGLGRELLRRDISPEPRGRLLAQLTRALRERSARDDARQVGTEALRLGERHHLPQVVREAAVVLGTLAIDAGDTTEAIRLFERAADTFVEAPDELTEAGIHSRLERLRERTPDQRIAALERDLEVTVRHGAADREWIGRSLLAATLLAQNQPSRALRQARLGLRAAESVQDKLGVLYTVRNLAETLDHLGRNTELRAALHRLREVTSLYDKPMIVALAVVMLADLDRREGHLADAEQGFATAWEVLRAIGETVTWAWAAQLEAELHAAWGDLPSALASLETAHRVGSAQVAALGSAPLGRQVQALLQLIRVHEAELRGLAGASDTVEAALCALDELRALDLAPLTGRACCKAGRLLARAGRDAEARTLRDEAVALMHAQGMGPDSPVGSEVQALEAALGGDVAS